jgi:hypothetical protein
VVQRDQGDVLAVAQPDQPEPQQRAAAEVERPAVMFLGEDPHPRLAVERRQVRQVDHRQIHRRGRGDPCGRPTVDRREHRSQRVVPLDDAVQAPPQDLPVHVADQPDGRREVVRRVARFEPVEEPEPLLAERHRHVGAFAAGQSRPGRGPLGRRDRRGEVGQDRRLEEFP